MNKATSVNQIEITANGTVQVRVALQIVDAGEVLSSKWHRTAFPPDCDIDAQCAAVDAHLARMKEEPLSHADIQRIKDFAAVAWTPEIIVAYKAAQE